MTRSRAALAADMAVAAPRAAPTFPLSFADPEYRRDPYPFYARIRREMPVFRLTRGRRGDSLYVTRFDDVMEVLRDTDRFVNNKANAGHRPSRIESAMSMGIDKTVIMQDGADHRRLRDLVHKAFTPARVAALDARIQQVVDELLDKAERKGEIDLIADLALPLPVTVISEMMGVSEHDRANFNRWMRGVLDLDGGSFVDILKDLPNVIQLRRFLRRLIEDRRLNRGDDLLSAMIAAEEAGDRLSFEELVASTFVLLLAGHETTVNLIGNGMLALLEHRDQLTRLRAEPVLIDSAVEELLRFGNPVQINAPRYARQDTEIGGIAISRGESVAPILASANRDGAQFPDPDRLDIARQPNRHVAFGFGVHYCLGAPLARLEGRAAFMALARRYPDIDLAIPRSALVWRPSLSVRGLSALPLRLH